MSQNSNKSSSFGERFGLALLAFFRGLLRLILILALLALVGAAAFYGFPWLYSHYVVPVQENTDRIDALESQQAGLELQLTQAATDTQTKLTTLESSRDSLMDEMAALQIALDELQQSLAEQNTADSEATSQFSEQLLTLITSVSNLEVALQELDTALADQESQIQSLAKATPEVAAPIEDLKRELQLLKAMELLTRARLSLAQNNFGLAAYDIGIGRDLLIALQPDVPDYQQVYLGLVVDRLQSALQNLKNAPVLVVDDLEVAWQLLARGLPQTAFDSIDLFPSLSVTETITGTEWITITLEVTSTLTLTPTQTSSP